MFRLWTDIFKCLISEKDGHGLRDLKFVLNFIIECVQPIWPCLHVLLRQDRKRHHGHRVRRLDFIPINITKTGELRLQNPTTSRASEAMGLITDYAPDTVDISGNRTALTLVISVEEYEQQSSRTETKN
jgi:hypothetical protein